MTSKRVYWDACSWIALIQKERILDEKGVLVEDRYTMCRSVINAAEKGTIEIATSTLNLAEVCKSTEVKATDDSKLTAFFEVEYILLVNLDRGIGEIARSLMKRGYSKLKPIDACHLASAAVANAEEFHTFDEKLLDLDGLIDKANKTKLRICRPDAGGAPAPLLEAMKPVLVEPTKVSPPKRVLDLEPGAKIENPKISLPEIEFEDNPNVTAAKKPTLSLEGPPVETRAPDRKTDPSK
jgi:predicted nucleic acid-binding protein